MKAIKYFLSITLLLVIVTGCKKDSFNDTSLVEGGADPAKLSVMFDITQDNTGLVTITPSGEGVASYDVYYGDSGANYMKVTPGKSIQHTYAEGLYNVKIVGHSLTGKTAEITQPLTVSFRAPENLKTSITSNGLAVNIGATALYETMFHVYYGDEADKNPEPYDSFLEGQAATHTYATAGTYTVRIVALSGGKATTQYTETIKVGKQIDLPLTFDDANYDYTTSNFGGNTSAIATDPANGANKVLMVTKPAGAETWAGTTLGTANGFATKIPVTATNSKMSMRIYSPAAGLVIKLKLEDHTNGNNAVETDVMTTKANQWETLTFDFKQNSAGTPALNPAFTYDKASVFFDFNAGGTGKVFYMDDLMFMAPVAPPAPKLSLPLTFEDPLLKYAFSDFDGGATTIIDNPFATGINTSSKVGKMVKNAGQTWGGSVIALDAPIDFSTKKTFKMKVYSPRVGAKILLKVENLNSGSINFEKEVTTTVANGWEELTFDYSAINTANTYQKIVLILDNGTAGNGSANYTIYFDDITLN
ncbi:hypothetical protein [Mucilaginibacter lacusdianchii]|uniref:hypothetical protein n=1 Tax=Mucilaginibacter lacusdianchii TaxID=2684211 RepID=UPI00131D5A7D|nr:hypothetical protein [Mucilaginibacter sp. JXJ CY 39]